jgi:repressor LexA
VCRTHEWNLFDFTDFSALKGLTMTTTTKLTKRQAMVLDAIAQHIQDFGYPPTIREIGDILDIRSTNGVNDHLKALERKGYLLRDDCKSRALRPLYHSDGRSFELGMEPVLSAVDEAADLEDIHRIPVLGRIAAGIPIEAIEQTDEVVAIGEGLIGRSDGVFALRVRGESMIEDGIFDGDYIFVKKQDDARDGEIVAAMVDGEATVKRLFRENGRLKLQPANSAMEPIYVNAADSRDTSILGKVVAVFRRV